jgi:hypothetical protein
MVLEEVRIDDESRLVIASNPKGDKAIQKNKTGLPRLLKSLAMTNWLW